MDDENKWINTADFKNWYLENYPMVPLTKPSFSLNDIFKNLISIPGAQFKFRSICIAEEEE